MELSKIDENLESFSEQDSGVSFDKKSHQSSDILNLLK